MAWTRLSKAVRAPGVCAECHAVVGPANLQADHIVPASVDPSRVLDPTNVRPLCKRCHEAKSRRERDLPNVY